MDIRLVSSTSNFNQFSKLQLAEFQQVLYAHLLKSLPINLALFGEPETNFRGKAFSIIICPKRKYFVKIDSPLKMQALTNR